MAYRFHAGELARRRAKYPRPNDDYGHRDVSRIVKGFCTILDQRWTLPDEELVLSELFCSHQTWNCQLRSPYVPMNVGVEDLGTKEP